MYLNALPLSFDDPIDAMLGFHRRIERQLATLGALPGMLEANGPDASSMAAAATVLDFFSRAMPVHHDDENELARAQSHRPLRARAGNGREAHAPVSLPVTEPKQIRH